MVFSVCQVGKKIFKSHRTIPGARYTDTFFPKCMETTPTYWPHQKILVGTVKNMRADIRQK
ncbi:hypothetical protein OBV_46080 [Oscillibacter valericigenes Sjm18-20]|nr:hypothetical protein OBV_46080 [Oscillibacter valericigenes Sjm18-20]